jgi:hypothetical protein
MSSTTSTFKVSPVPDDVLRRARSERTDASGNPVVNVTATGGEPLRCCLRDAVAGEALLLFGYEPVLPPSPYREVGAVFAHEAPCGGPVQAGCYPPEWRGRPQVLRAYDQRGWICDARVHDGTDPDAVIDEILQNDAVVQIHSRNIAYGCFMFLVRREAPSGAVDPDLGTDGHDVVRPNPIDRLVAHTNTAV